MVKLRIYGGLGNQIFQLGAAILLDKKSKEQLIEIDCSGLNSYKVKRENLLSDFFNFDKFSTKITYKKSLILKARLAKVFSYNISKNIFCSDNNFKTISSNSINLVYLDGYFQDCISQNDFDNQISYLKYLLITPNLSINEGCIIHIRGGDFLSLGWNQVSSFEYYKCALEYISKKFNCNAFYVVTDDRKYASNLMERLELNYNFIGGTIKEDFFLIGSFKYRILSSSTFAFWASALGNNDFSKVIAPKYWSPGKKRTIKLPNEIIL